MVVQVSACHLTLAKSDKGGILWTRPFGIASQPCLSTAYPFVAMLGHVV